MSTEARPRPSRPGSLNALAAVIVLIAVLVLAVRASSASPPAVAEFAPVAQTPIRDAPPDQASTLGTSAGGGVGGGLPSPSPAVTPVPATALFYRCVGDPPRQIEDPQSPPCVPYWSGANGGATSRGVTAQTINVAWVYQQSNQSTDTVEAEAAALQRFFNARFNFYGRSIALHEFRESDASSAGQEALAESVRAAGSFASTQMTDSGGLQYHEDLARKGVISNFGFEANPTETDLQQFDPYLWSYTMAADQMMREIGSWYCAELNGHRAAHTVPPLSGQMRKLGVVYHPWDTTQQTSMQPLLDALGRCGISPPVINAASSNDTGATTALQLSTDHVTSVLCLCDYPFWSINVAESASSQGYYPEWLNTSYGGGDTQFAFHFGNPPPEQARDTFGLTFLPRQERVANDPMWWGWKEGDPTSSGPRNLIDVYQGHLLYRSLLQLVSGFQMAGAGLNPSSFKAGLQRTVFPNPVTSIHAGAVGFVDSHAMTLDAAEWWYDPAASSPWSALGDSVGAICYVNSGTRRTPTDWQAGKDPDLFFQGPCDSG